MIFLYIVGCFVLIAVAVTTVALYFAPEEVAAIRAVISARWAERTKR